MMKVFKSKCGTLTIIDEGSYMLIRAMFGNHVLIHHIETKNAPGVIDMYELEDGMPIDRLFAIVDEKLGQ